MKKLHSPILGMLIMWGALVPAVEAATVSLIPSTAMKLPGDTLILDVEGTGFTDNADGGSFTTTWDPSVLILKSVSGGLGVSIVNPPWDTQFVTDSDESDGLLDTVSVATSTFGGVGPDFSIATLTFDVIGLGTTTVTMTDDPLFGGWVAPGTVPIPVTYEGAVVNSVPIPAAVWLFGSGLLGLTGIARRSRVVSAT